jgi:hypothetical protein
LANTLQYEYNLVQTRSYPGQKTGESRGRQEEEFSFWNLRNPFDPEGERACRTTESQLLMKERSFSSTRTPCSHGNKMDLYVKFSSFHPCRSEELRNGRKAGRCRELSFSPRMAQPRTKLFCFPKKFDSQQHKFVFA